MSGREPISAEGAGRLIRAIYGIPERPDCECSCPHCGPLGAHDCGKPACVNPAGLNPSERDRLRLIRGGRP